MKNQNENKDNYKQTSIGWIPENWELRQLGECCVVKGEYGLNAAAVEYNEQLPPYIRITDIDEDGNFIVEGKKSVNDINSSNFILEVDDILFARTGATVGKTYLHIKENGTLVFAGFLIRFRMNVSVLNPYYLKLFTTTKIYWDWVKVMSMRSGQPGINASEYTKLELPVPPIEEQEFIIDILRNWDYTIEYSQKLIIAKEKLKNSLMQQLLPLKNVAHVDAKSSYEEKSLKDFLVPISREVKKPLVKYLSLGIKSHRKGTFLKNDFDPDDIMLDTLFEVKENDLIVNITFAWEGAIAIAGKQDNGALVSHRFPTFEFNSSVCIPEYFKFIIKTKWFTYLLGSISPGGAGRNRVLSKKDFLKLKVLLPQVDEQIRISNILNTLSKEIDLLKLQLELYRQQKKGLMQVLLTGAVRIKI